jgi:hypothetical protein
VKILHVVGRSLVRNTPARIARYWGTNTEHTGTALCLRRPGGPNCFKEPLNAYGIFCALGRPRGEVAELIRSADVIHFHDDGYPSMLPELASRRDVPMAYQAHIGDLVAPAGAKRGVSGRMFTRQVSYDKRVKHACITNGYGRHFDAEEQRARVKWGRLPDILELENPIYRAGSDRPETGPLRVVFTYSNTAHHRAKINGKSPDEHKALVAGIEGVDFRWVANVSFERSQDYKRWAHVVMDECFTPYTNLACLEGSAAGACVVVNADEYTVRDLCSYLDAPPESYPWIRVTPETLRPTIERLRDNPREAIERGRAGRAWMEKYYGTRRLLERFLEFYRS